MNSARKCSQLGGANPKGIKHDHFPIVYAALDPNYSIIPGQCDPKRRVKIDYTIILCNEI